MQRQGSALGGFPDLKRLPRRGAEKNARGVVIVFGEVRSLDYF
ncbi:hypothetical protein [Nostoc piscinale]|nr:hypothetical protein [Nostoc piscinale]